MSAVSFGNVRGKDFEEQASALVEIGALVLFCTCVQMDIVFLCVCFFMFSEKMRLGPFVVLRYTP